MYTNGRCFNPSNIYFPVCWSFGFFGFLPHYKVVFFRLTSDSKIALVSIAQGLMTLDKWLINEWIDTHIVFVECNR